MKTALYVLGATLLVGIVSAYFLMAPFRAPEAVSEEVVSEEIVDESVEEVVAEEEVVFESFIVPLNSSVEAVAQKLKDEEWIKSSLALRIAFISKGGGSINPGGYQLARSMDAFEVASVLRGEPYMKWVIIPEGLRKEEVGEYLARALDWSADERIEWANVYGDREEYREGVYFPDTYLIPLSESPTEVAARMVRHFNEVFAPYQERFTEENIRWTTGLTLASLVQREAAGPRDMSLIAGILWNRLDVDMLLNVDATLQYMRGDTGDGWWAPIDIAEKQIDSPFNSYMYRGLPPHPIASPGRAAIEAVLEPEETDCFYYLHSDDGEIFCSVTYEEHMEKIEEVFD